MHQMSLDLAYRCFQVSQGSPDPCSQGVSENKEGPGPRAWCSQTMQPPRASTQSSLSSSQVSPSRARDCPLETPGPQLSPIVPFVSPKMQLPATVGGSRVHLSPH